MLVQCEHLFSCFSRRIFNKAESAGFICLTIDAHYQSRETLSWTRQAEEVHKVGLESECTQTTHIQRCRGCEGLLVLFWSQLRLSVKVGVFSVDAHRFADLGVEGGCRLNFGKLEILEHNLNLT